MNDDSGPYDSAMIDELADRLGVKPVDNSKCAIGIIGKRGDCYSLTELLLAHVIRLEKDRTRLDDAVDGLFRELML